MCYKNLITSIVTETKLKCVDITGFADLVSVSFVQRQKEKTKLFKTSQNVEQVAELNDEFTFDCGVLWNYGDKYV